MIGQIISILTNVNHHKQSPSVKRKYNQTLFLDFENSLKKYTELYRI